MAAPALECRHLDCGHHGHAILGDINLQLIAGESVALLGINGSGKSTLLKTISRTLAPIRGEVHLSGKEIHELTFQQLAHQVAYVPQEEIALFPFPVREVVAMGRLARSTGLFDTPEDLAITEEAMKTADCLDLADRPITELSGGERQRVLIARALAQDAPLILLDEPTSHLDAAHQMATAKLARSLANAGKAVLVAMHDLNLSSRVASRGVLIHQGKAVMDAPLAEVLQSPVLDEVYKVRFQRIALEPDLILVVPVG